MGLATRTVLICSLKWFKLVIWTEDLPPAPEQKYLLRAVVPTESPGGKGGWIWMELKSEEKAVQNIVWREKKQPCMCTYLCAYIHDSLFCLDLLKSYLYAINLISWDIIPSKSSFLNMFRLTPISLEQVVLWRERETVWETDLNKQGFCCRTSQSLEHTDINNVKQKEMQLLPASYDQEPLPQHLMGPDGKCCFKRIMQEHTHTNTQEISSYLVSWEGKIEKAGFVLWQFHFCKHRTRKARSALWCWHTDLSL